MELKWLGHASWKLKTKGQVIYIDPYEGEYDDQADIILSTHHHDDHCKPDARAPLNGAGRNLEQRYAH